MPELMCVSCIQQVSRAYTFRKRYRSSYETLTTLLTNTEVATDVSEIEKDDPICQAESECDPINAHNVAPSSSLIPNSLLEKGGILNVDINLSIQPQQIVPEHENDELITLQEIVIQDESAEQTLNDLQVQEVMLVDPKSQEEQSMLDTLSTEVETLELNVAFECSLCSTTFSSNDELQSHIELIHSTSAMPLNQDMTTTMQPINDINENVKKNKFECPECHKCFRENKIL